MAMLDSAQDLVAVFLSLAFVWLLSGRLALGKQREPRGAPPAPSKARPSGFSRRPGAARGNIGSPHQAEASIGGAT